MKLGCGLSASGKFAACAFFCEVLLLSPTMSSCWVCGLIIEDFGYREGCLITVFDLLLSPPLCSAAYAQKEVLELHSVSMTFIQYVEDENSSEGLD